MSSKSDFAKEIARLYEEAGHATPATTPELAAFAVQTGRYTPKPTDIVKQCAEDIAQGFREDYFTSPQGQRVRRFHATRKRTLGGEQQVFWAEIRSAPR